MKQSICTGIVLLYLLSIQLSAQERLDYSYDASGNRIERSLYIGGQKKSESADESIDHELEFNETLNDVTIKLYPNPTEGKLTLEFMNLRSNIEAIVRIYDTNGKMIITKEIYSERTEFDLTPKSSGSYFLIIQIGEEVSRWKVIKR